MKEEVIKVKLADVLEKSIANQEEIKQELRNIGDKINSVDKRLLVIETRMEEQKKSIDKIPELTNEAGKIQTRLDEQKNSIDKIPELAEKVGELKNWRRIALLIITGFSTFVLGWIAKSGRS